MSRPDYRPPGRRFFYDTEFIEDGRTIELISIGVVAEGGESFYAVSTEFDPAAAGPWVRRNVLDQLPSPADPAWQGRQQIRAGLLEFFTGSTTGTATRSPTTVGRSPRGGPPDHTQPGAIELWAWHGGYDHVALAQLWGDMTALPRVIPRFSHDLRQRWEDLGRPRLPPEPPGTRHDALADARHNLSRWRVLEDRRDGRNWIES